MDLNNIDPRFIDVNFQAEAQRHGYSLGYNGVGAAVNKMRSYADVVPTLTESQIQAEIEKIDAAGGGAERLVTRIYDQNGEGSCVANACSQANEIVQALQFGKENVVHLSAMSLYQRIGSGPNSGADQADGLDEMQARGVLPLDNPENRAKFGDQVMPNCGWRNPKPAGWEKTAARFKVDEALVLRSVLELMTALVNQHPVVVGRAGHSICYCRPVYKGGFSAIYANSWGSWGFAAGDFQNGFGLDSPSMVRSSSQWAFAIRSLTVPTPKV